METTRNTNTRRRPVAGHAAAFVALLTLAVLGVDAQTSTADMQKAREETAVVYDLGRFFGYVHGMTTENASLALTASQATEIAAVMDEISEMDRVEPAWASETLERLELDVLSPAQLMEVDRRAITWQNSRESTASTAGTGTGSSGGSGGGPLGSYVAGGPFNPIVDESRTIGQGFAALREHLAGR
jgi:hypothetical protein